MASFNVQMASLRGHKAEIFTNALLDLADGEWDSVALQEVTAKFTEEEATAGWKAMQVKDVM